MACNMFTRHHLTCFILIATPLLAAAVAEAQTLRNEAARIGGEAMKVRIDPDLCQGHAMCALACPQL